MLRRLGVSCSMAAVGVYCWEFECEADDVGLELLIKACYDSNKARKLFEHLEEKKPLWREEKSPFFQDPSDRRDIQTKRPGI